jgi:clan AA aspartic protease
VTGYVDELLRALLEVRVRRFPTDEPDGVTVWIDTAFNGHLVFSKRLIDPLGLKQEAATDAILADGRQVTLESYVCHVEWLGTVVSAQVIANEGKLPLLGTELLAGHLLQIDYAEKRVSVV